MRAVVVGWNNLPGDHNMKRLKNVMLDHTLTPLIGNMLCVKQMFFNPHKFIESNGNGGAIGRCGRFTIDPQKGGVTFELEQRLKVTRHISGRSALVGSIDNFGHYVINDLPRLIEASKYASEFDNFIIGPTPPYVLEFMQHLDLDPRNALSIGEGELALIEDLTLFPLQCYAGWRSKALNVAPSFPGALRARCAQISPSPHRRLYFPRRTARWRRITNEEAVLELLTEFGFEEYLPEHHSIADQMATVGAAELIACPFGASAQMGVFAPSNAGMVVIEPPSGQHRVSKWLDLSISLAGVRMYRVIGEEVISENIRPEDADYTVNIEKLRKVVEMALRRESGYQRSHRDDHSSSVYLENIFF